MHPLPIFLDVSHRIFHFSFGVKAGHQLKHLPPSKVSKAAIR
jgi:hypothetical protein